MNMIMTFLTNEYDYDYKGWLCYGHDRIFLLAILEETMVYVLWSIYSM